MNSIHTTPETGSNDWPVVFLNGAYLPRDQAVLSVLERGTMFGDGVYEVIRYDAGRAFEMERHLQRLHRSLAGVELAHAQGIYDLPGISQRLIQRNGLTDAKVYWQITRGPAMRDHHIPEHVEPTVLAMADPIVPIDPDQAVPTMSGALVEDTRWSRCWIKSLMLLPNVLAKAEAGRCGAGEAVLVRDGIVTEGGSTNVFIVRDGAIWTHPADRWILGGITRAVVFELAEELGIPIHERRFSPDDLAHADDLFITGTTTNLARLAHVDGSPLAADHIDLPKPSPVTHRLYQALIGRLLHRDEGR